MIVCWNEVINFTGESFLSMPYSRQLLSLSCAFLVKSQLSLLYTFYLALLLTDLYLFDLILDNRLVYLDPHTTQPSLQLTEFGRIPDSVREWYSVSHKSMSVGFAKPRTK